MAEEKVEKFVALEDLYIGWARSNAKGDVIENTESRLRELGFLDEDAPKVAKASTKKAQAAQSNDDQEK